MLHAPGSGPMRREHRHAELEFNLVTGGRAAYLVDGRRCELGPDTVACLRPAEQHILLDRTPDFRMWIAVFRPALVRHAALRTADADAEPDDAWPPCRWLDPDAPIVEGVTRVVDERTAGRLSAELDRLCRGDAALSPAARVTAFAWALHELFAAWAAADNVPEGTHLHPAVERAARWLHDHAADERADDLPALAQRVGVSRWWLSRLFRQQVGVSLTAFRRRRRAELAVEMLGRGGRMTATEAAYAAGFGSYAQFYRAVRALTGEPPAALVRRRG